MSDKEYVTGVPSVSAEYSGSLVGVSDLQHENAQLRARIAELEAAAQWHPASEPPEEEGNTGMSRAVLIQEKSGDCYTDWYQHDQKRWHFSKRIVRWRDLPSMPEEPQNGTH